MAGHDGSTVFEGTPALRLNGREHGDRLLPVIGEHLVAASADASAVFLQTREHRLVTIIHDGTAVTRHVAGACIVLALRRLRRDGRRQNGKGNNQRKERNKPDHYVNPQSIPRLGINSGITSYQPVHIQSDLGCDEIVAPNPPTLGRR
jgi:hypothetical protein